MEIRKVELDSKIEAFIEAEQQGYEAKHGILCNYTPFCFTALGLDRQLDGYGLIRSSMHHAQWLHVV